MYIIHIQHSAFSPPSVPHPSFGIRIESETNLLSAARASNRPQYAHDVFFAAYFLLRYGDRRT
jgi:hypothetical protein